MDRTDLPPSASHLTAYINRAKELHSECPLGAFYCRLFVADKLNKLRGTDTENAEEITALLVEQLDVAEALSAGAAAERPFTRTQFVQFCLGVFRRGMSDDEKRNVSEATLKRYYCAGLFLDVLTQFGPLDAILEKKRQYSRKRAAELTRAISSGLPLVAPLPDAFERYAEGVGSGEKRMSAEEPEEGDGCGGSSEKKGKKVSNLEKGEEKSGERSEGEDSARYSSRGEDSVSEGGTYLRTVKNTEKKSPIRGTNSHRFSPHSSPSKYNSRNQNIIAKKSPSSKKKSDQNPPLRDSDDSDLNFSPSYDDQPIQQLSPPHHSSLDPPAKVHSAIKLCRHAIEALKFEDIEGARSNLKEALGVIEIYP